MLATLHSGTGSLMKQDILRWFRLPESVCQSSQVILHSRKEFCPVLASRMHRCQQHTLNQKVVHAFIPSKKKLKENPNCYLQVSVQSEQA